eukprot:CAMPEP_0198236346 /NCGR_PEP_ID=MMETSP1446-20131203/2237_1 /TAXON_ID=1461542 ORGANISM="Unidentified sp, Strain CCMP2111" /NCGR_SAMPLE_ID=MMETSP1446 /ASSEMBLY_ACC=CAM_ASM_001112 /LENGTH=251 /DNA_ID=CAMNT_0043918057 /DNA_START=81 /DNA_END=836 /DNA_ORIENTATION=-
MKAVDNTVRRKWDAEEFAEKAKQRAAEEEAQEKKQLTARQKKWMARDPLHQGLIQERSSLKKREDKVDYAANIGQTRVVNITAERGKQAGFYCDVCDVLMKDSLAFADHLNGKIHQRLLGMSMRTERVGLGGVKEKMAALREKKEAEQRKRRRVANGEEDPDEDGYDEKMARLREEDERIKEARKQRREEKRKKKAQEREAQERSGAAEHLAGGDGDKQAQGGEGGEDDDGQGDVDIMAAMGFGGFGTSKK